MENYRSSQNGGYSCRQTAHRGVQINQLLRRDAPPLERGEGRGGAEPGFKILDHVGWLVGLVGDLVTRGEFISCLSRARCRSRKRKQEGKKGSLYAEDTD